MQFLRHFAIWVWLEPRLGFILHTKQKIRMELKDIVSVAGMAGLHKVIGKNKTGLILETLDSSAKKFSTSPTQRVSILADVSMFGNEEDVKLVKILKNIEKTEKAGKTIPSGKDSESDIKNCMAEVFPEYDAERVYVSDMKKLFNWYHILKDKLNIADLSEEEETETDSNESGEEKVVKKTTDKPAVKNVKTSAPRTVSGAKSKTTTPRKMGS